MTLFNVVCSRPCLVEQYGPGKLVIGGLPSNLAPADTLDSLTPGPFQLTVPPLDRLNPGNTTFATPVRIHDRTRSSADSVYFVVVAAPTDVRSTIQLDGRPLADDVWMHVGNYVGSVGWSIAATAVDLSIGWHTVTATGVYALVVYGHCAIIDYSTSVAYHVGYRSEG